MIYTSPINTAEAAAIAITTRSELSLQNTHCLTLIPFWLRISLQSKPASEAENVKVKAPKFEPMARAYIEASRSLGSRVGPASCIQSWSTRAASMVAPMFVPQIYQSFSLILNLNSVQTHITQNTGDEAHSSNSTDRSGSTDPP